VRRIARLLIPLCALAAAVVPAASGAERMWIGFHDDPSFRWVDDRTSRIQLSAEQGASIMRLLVQWNVAAPRRPTDASDPFDPAYNLSDVDEAVQTAQEQDQEVMLTISGTPAWANGGKKANVMPKRLADFTTFARAVASRYSGRYQGYPFVRFWAVWNEPNLNLFLTPQFNSAGKSVAPANYAKLYAAGYAGIKAGNPLAKVAIGETSARGKDSPGGAVISHSPGKFAELVAKANPRLKFDAWAHHPYPSNPNNKPTQVVTWPNVSLMSLPRFEQSLNTWFHRKTTSIWITEYGHQTRPPEALGIPWSTQSKYIAQAIGIARKFSFVTMFIWFVYQDDPGQPWESGLYTQGGVPKASSPSRFEATAKPLDARSGLYSFKRGTLTPLVNLYARRYCANDSAGTLLGMTWRIFLGTKLLKVGQQTATLKRDCSIDARIQFPPGKPIAKGKTYTATFALNDKNGILLNRKITIRGT
jgi:aryl-phospho-beta-D-glucosidase BglC (GH1 family)